MLIGAAPVAPLDLSFTNLRSDKGLVRICITTAPKNFPACRDAGQAVTRSIPAATRHLRIEGLPIGDYAVAVIHDENGNSRLDTFAGIPREGFGFSRNPAIGFGPPGFAAARFTLDATGAAQEIRLRYLL